MSSSFSNFSSLDNSSSCSSGSDNGSSGGRSSIGDASSSYVSSLMIALEVFQGSVGDSSFRNSHGLGYTSLRVEPLEVRRLVELHAHFCMVCL